MARRFRRRSSHRGSRRKNRWLGFSWDVDITLEADLGAGVSWVSFWAKWPASQSSSAGGRAIAVNEEVVPSNEPVDETLMRILATNNLRVTNPGSAGLATNPINYSIGLIPFDGGEYPSFYDFATFQSGASFTAPPHPILQMDDPWVWRYSFMSSAEVTFFSPNGSDLAIQSRARRKLPAGVGLLAVIGAISFLSAGTTPTNIFGGGEFRMLVKSGFSV